MNRDLAADYIRTNFEPSDRLAVIVRSRQTEAVTQRISSANRIASQEFQARPGFATGMRRAMTSTSP